MGFMKNMYKPKERNVEKLQKLAEKLKELGKFKEDSIDTSKQHHTDTRSANSNIPD